MTCAAASIARWASPWASDATRNWSIFWRHPALILRLWVDMPGNPPPRLWDAPTLAVTPCHVVRAGQGLDALAVQVRGTGLMWGGLGTRLVRGSWDVVVLRPSTGRTLKVSLLGPGGFRTLNVTLPPVLAVHAPAVQRARVAAPRVDNRSFSPPEALDVPAAVFVVHPFVPSPPSPGAP